MSNRHEDFLDNGTRYIEDFFSANNVSAEEREYIVNAFTDELMNNIGNTNILNNYDLIIHSASARFLDNRISQLLAKRNIDSTDRRLIIENCERLQNELSVFEEKNWSLPKIQNIHPLSIKEIQLNEERRIQAEKDRIEQEKREQAEREEQKRLESLRRKEQERLEQERLLAEKEQRKKRLAQKKRRIIVKSSVAVIAFVGFMLLYSLVLFPLFKYNNAVHLINSGKYDQAISKFEDLKDYRDSKNRILQAKASRLYDEGDLAGAYEIYALLDDDYNQHLKDYQDFYATADQFSEKGQYDEAFDLFYSLGNFNNSREKGITLGKELALKYEEDQNYPAASKIYKKLGMEEQVREADYKQASYLSAKGEYLAASDIWLSEAMTGYKDSRKLNYEMAVSLMSNDPQTAVQILRKDIDYPGSKQVIYNIASNAVTNADYEFAIDVFSSISDYKDSVNKIKEAEYLLAEQLLEKHEYTKALEIYLSLGNYKSSVTQAKECNYQIASSYLNNSSFKEGYELFIQLGDYKDSAEQAKNCKYQEAVSFKEKGKYGEAYAAFSSLGEYKDSKDQANETGYKSAKQLMADGHYAEASSVFKEINGFEDSQTQAQECDYLRANELIQAEKYPEAIQLLSSLGSYKNSRSLSSKACYLLAAKYEKDGDYAHALEVYSVLSDNPEASEKVFEMHYQLGNMKYQEGDINGALADLEQALRYSGTKVLILKIASNARSSKDYDTAEKAYLALGDDEDGYKGLYALGDIFQRQGDLNKAISLYGEAGTYKDSAERKKQLENQVKIAQMTKSTVFSVGNIVIFGSYEQDNNTGNGKEPIEWIVVDQKDTNVLLVSKYALDVQQYNYTWKQVTWADSSLRHWLNKTFLPEAFSSKEQEGIVLSEITNSLYDGNPDYTLSGPTTKDKVFLLSYREVKQYFPSDSARQLENTPYTRPKAEFGLVLKHGGNHCYWLTRSPGNAADQVAIVSESGSLSECKSVDDIAMATRPAIWLNTESVAAKESLFAVGSIVSFGHYGDKANNTYEPLRWIVIEKNDNSAMLLAEKVIDNMQFHNKRIEGLTWEKSDLRTWLNKTFYTSAFNSDEKNALCNVEYILSSNEGVEGYYKITSKKLSDPVFLLSYSQIKKAFNTMEKRRVKSTDYAKKMGAGDYCCWWLLSPGSDKVSVACIDENGKAVSRWATDKRGVRPAIMIDFSFGLKQVSNGTLK